MIIFNDIFDLEAATKPSPLFNFKVVLDENNFHFRKWLYWSEGYLQLFMDGFCMRIMFFPKKRSEKCRNL